MIDSNDYQHIVSDLHYLELALPGRTIKSFDWREGEIHFDDGSVLTFTWHSDSIGFELFEDPLEG